MMSVNPFYLFNKISEGKITNAYVEMRALRGGKKAKDVLLIMNNRTNSRLGIVTAKELQIEGDLLSGKDVTIISSVDSKIENNYDHLVIENQVAMSTKAENLSQLLDDADWHMGIEYLPLRMVLAKAALKKGSIFHSSLGLDIARRFSIGFCPLLFTLLGAAFGLEVGRNLTRKGIFWSVVLAALYLCCFLSGKSMKETPLIGWLLFFIPYPIIFLFALRSLRMVSRGLE
jgi:lipopolysaccharide export system permease protein